MKYEPTQRAPQTRVEKKGVPGEFGGKPGRRLNGPAARFRVVKEGTLDFSRWLEKKKKPGRNDPCYCGSGRKFKKCHGR